MLIQVPSGSFMAVVRPIKLPQCRELGEKKSLLMQVSVAVLGKKKGDKDELLFLKAWPPLSHHWSVALAVGKTYFIAGTIEKSEYADKETGEQKTSESWMIEFIAEQCVPITVGDK